MRRVAISAALVLAAAPAAAGELSVAATELRIVTDAGLVRGVEVAGAELALPGLGTVRIESAERDAGSRFGDVWLYRVVLEDGREICAADPGGDTRLVFFPGRFDAQLNYVDDPAEFSVSCVSGVQAKCLRWGYRPWAKAPLGGQPLAPYYNACIRAARADYCGDDQPTTRDGTLIDLYDQVGVQQRLLEANQNARFAIHRYESHRYWPLTPKQTVRHTPGPGTTNGSDHRAR